MTDHLLRLKLPPPKPGLARTRELLTRARTGDTKAREQLIKENLRLVVKIARRFTGRGHELEDLFQIGTIGLMKAVDKFDLSYNVQFSTYAVPMIAGEIRRFIRDDAPVKISRIQKTIAYKGCQAQQALAQQLGRDPSISEIAATIDVSPEELVCALEAVQTPASLSDPIYKNGISTIKLQDRLEEDNNNWIRHIMLKQVLEKLDPRERFIIKQRFFAHRTQTEIAAELGLSQVQISRLEKQILLKIRGLLESG